MRITKFVKKKLLDPLTKYTVIKYQHTKYEYTLITFNKYLGIIIGLKLPDIPNQKYRRL